MQISSFNMEETVLHTVARCVLKTYFNWLNLVTEKDDDIHYKISPSLIGHKLTSCDQCLSFLSLKYLSQLWEGFTVGWM